MDPLSQPENACAVGPACLGPVCLATLLLTVIGGGEAVKAAENAPPAKPKVIVMTDGEIDDHSSMIRFLLYTWWTPVT